jgi:hypothetical protein
MLRLLISLSLLSAILPGCTSLPTEEKTAIVADFDPVADQVATQGLIQDIFDNIWSGIDTSQVRRYQTDDFVILEHGEVWTNDTIRNWQLGVAANKAADAPERRNSFDFFRTEQNGDEIWMAYYNTANWVDEERDTVRSAAWLESAVAVRTDGGWKLRMMHSTRMPRE